MSTDLWGRWELSNSDWHYTSLINYPEGKNPHKFGLLISFADSMCYWSGAETERMLVSVPLLVINGDEWLKEGQHMLIKLLRQKLSQVERSSYIANCCVCVLFLTLHWLCVSVLSRPVAEYLQAVQATSVLACVFAILALFVFVAQLFTLPKGQRFTFTGVLQLIACK